MCDLNFDFVVKPVSVRDAELEFDVVEFAESMGLGDKAASPNEDCLDFTGDGGEVDLGGFNLNLDFSHF